MYSKDRIIQHEIPREQRKISGADVFFLYNKHYLCIIDYNSKVQASKKKESLLADSLILEYKIFLSEYGLPNKTMSDACGNFVSEKFKEFCRSLNI